MQIVLQPHFNISNKQSIQELVHMVRTRTVFKELLENTENMRNTKFKEQE